MHHWTNRMIEVHALCCGLALLLRGLMMRRVRAAELKISTDKVLKELAGVCDERF